MILGSLENNCCRVRTVRGRHRSHLGPLACLGAEDLDGLDVVRPTQHDEVILVREAEGANAIGVELRIQGIPCR